MTVTKKQLETDLAEKQSILTVAKLEMDVWSNVCLSDKENSMPGSENHARYVSSYWAHQAELIAVTKKQAEVEAAKE